MIMKTFASNRKASYEYFFVRNLNAGIQLRGSEVKQIRDGKISLVDSFCYFNENELYVKNMLISQSNISFSHDPLRDKKLLLNRKELDKLEKDLVVGMTIVVKRVFSNERNVIKLEIALAKGKKSYDKRESIKENESKKQINFYI